MPTVVCLLVAGPGGHIHSNRLQFSPHHRDRMASIEQHHHQMSYQNMFISSGEPGTIWRCTACGKEVTNRWHHYHSHTPQRSICPYCPSSYSRIDTLRSHLRSKHADRLSKH